MKPFYIKQNDTGQSLRAYPQSAETLDFGGATAVFNMRKKGTSSVKVDRSSATIASDASGDYFQYDWRATDTDDHGEFEGEFEITLSSGRIETYPSRGFIPISIADDIA